MGRTTQNKLKERSQKPCPDNIKVYCEPPSEILAILAIKVPIQKSLFLWNLNCTVRALMEMFAK